MKCIKHLCNSLTVLATLSGCAALPPQFYQQNPDDRKISEGTGVHWIVSTQGRAATDAVKWVYDQGGNIIDAAIAASWVISVERPQSTGIGGGGFLLYREGSTQKTYAIDFRERAPQKASENMYLNEKGEVIEDKSTVGKYAVAVPGLVKGLTEIHKKFGKLKFATLLKPAIQLAREGFEVYPKLQEALQKEQGTLKKFKSSQKIFIKTDGQPYSLGQKLVQKNLARSLEHLAETEGRDFYEGSIGAEIVAATEHQITERDLAQYKVIWREPLVSNYKGYEVITMPPPSSGGTHLIEILNILEDEKLENETPQSDRALRLTAQAMRLAFLDRTRYMGDTDFVKVPFNTLASKGYAARLKLTDAWKKPGLSDQDLQAASPLLNESSETTHLSIMDRDGNAVVTTQTINGHFGSGMVAGNTGIVLNNEMDDFSAKPGSSNQFGAIGSNANRIQPKKTPLSSMTPTILVKDTMPVLAVGAPGGTRIITCVAQTILNRIDFKMSLYDSIAALRIHHQFKPDEIQIETGMNPKKINALTQAGFKVNVRDVPCAVMAVASEGGQLLGVSEPRDFGKSIGN